MKRKVCILRFRPIDKDIFEALRGGKKKVETRAATEKYRRVQKDDALTFVYGSRRFQKRVASVRIFRSVRAMLQHYAPHNILPGATSPHDLYVMYKSFPLYPEKLKKFGIIAFTFQKPRRKTR